MMRAFVRSQTRPGLRLAMACLPLLAACSRDAVRSEALPQSAAVEGTRLTCKADVRAGTVSCDGGSTSSGLHASRMVGGQGMYVRMTSSGVAYAGTTFSFNATVQNLTDHSMATADGATRDGAGVQVFLSVPPTATTGNGTITVLNATGTATFLGPQQSFYQYGGQIGGVDQGELGADGILSPGEVSSAKAWQFDVPASVTTFSFQVYVSTEMPAGTPATVAPQISGISPATLVPGQTATITGYNFNATPASNTITIGGQATTITGGMGTTQLTVTVPCVSSGTASVQAATGGKAGVPYGQPLQVAQRTLAVGQSLVLTSSAESACNELTSAGGPARYVVAVFSANTSPSSNAPFQLSADGVAADAAPGPLASRSAEELVAPHVSLEVAMAAARQKVEDDRHFRLLDENREQYERLHARFPNRASMRGPRLNRNVVAGDPPLTRSFRVSNINATAPDNICNSYYVLSATRVYFNGKLAIYEDDATPDAFKSALNPTMAANYQAIGDQFNADMEPIVRNNFGDVLRRDAETDNNGVEIALFTPRINTSFSGFAGFVVSCDQYPNDDSSTPAVGGPYTGSAGSTNGASNFGEFFYAYQPVSNTTGYGANTPQNWYRTLRSTFIHESKHIAAYSARVANGAPTFEASWLEEGTARHAEELWMRNAVDNVAWKANTGYGSFANPINVYCDTRPGFAECDANPRRPASIMQRHFNSLYTNMFGTNARLLSPFGATPSDNASYFYATSWSLARYAIDRYGASDAAFLTALTQSTTSGTTNLSAQAGVSITQLLGGWALSLYADDYPGLASPSPDIQMPTWNFRSIYAGLNADFPSTYTLPYPLVPQARSFGSFAPVGVTTLRGGGVLWYEISGTQTAAQLLRLQASGGGTPSTDLRIAVARLQ